MENIYYVYEWIRLDTNEPFYVGKGKDDRWKTLTRGNNRHFNNIVKSIPVAVNILHDNLDEEVAFELEVWYIREYRDIIGYDLVNMNDGGEGQTICGENHYLYGKGYLIEGENNPNYGNGDKIRGENNPMYGKNAYEGKTEEEMKEILKKRLETLNNRTEEEKEKTRKKKSEAVSGENNPMWNKRQTQETKDKMSKIRIEKGLSKGENNPNYGKHGKNHHCSKPVICITTNAVFYSAKDGANYYNCNPASVGYCCMGSKPKKGERVKVNFAGKLTDGTKLVWRYLTIIEL